jgi:hypothetical protein
VAVVSQGLEATIMKQTEEECVVVGSILNGCQAEEQVLASAQSLQDGLAM